MKETLKEPLICQTRFGKFKYVISAVLISLLMVLIVIGSVRNAHAWSFTTYQDPFDDSVSQIAQGFGAKVKDAKGAFSVIVRCGDYLRVYIMPFDLFFHFGLTVDVKYRFDQSDFEQDTWLWLGDSASIKPFESAVEFAWRLIRHDRLVIQLEDGLVYGIDLKYAQEPVGKVLDACVAKRPVD